MRRRRAASARVLGIDPGLRCTGVAVVGGGPPSALTLVTPPRVVWPHQVSWIVERVVARARAWGVTHAGLETVLWHGPRRGVMHLALLTGALWGALILGGIPVSLVSPTLTKRMAKPVSSAVLVHAADALAVARWVWHGLGGRS